MSLIPEEHNYQEYCKHCHEYYVPHWTNCQCKKSWNKPDLNEIMKLVENRLTPIVRTCERDVISITNDNIEVYCPEEDSKTTEKVPEKPLKKPFKNKSPTEIDIYLDRLAARWFS